MPDSPAVQALRDRIRDLIARGADAQVGDDEFSAIARSVFAHQYENNAPYRAYCARRGVAPEHVDRWLDIPAVPTDAFKATALVAGDPANAVASFRTSGTTAGRERRGVHHFIDLTLYNAALLRGFDDVVLNGARLPILSLVPSRSEQPDSSLSHMIAEVVDEFGANGSGWFVSLRDGLDLERLQAALDEAIRADAPIVLIGTSLAFVHLFEALEEGGTALILPDGSRAMDTGGFKGESREVGRQEVLDRFAVNLGLPAERIYNEYGMTEMSSQMYAVGAGLHRSPPWLRSWACDPATLKPLPAGEAGLLRHCDIANLDSVAALQTADLGRVTPDGIELLGRARGAEARGCSIAMDELLTAIGRGG